MTTCERCSTENLEGSQYCDECGAPMSAPARSNRPVEKGNSGSTSDPKRSEAVAMVAHQSDALAAHQSETAQPQSAPAYAVSAGALALMEESHSRLVIERGRSAGKQFPLSDDESQIGRWDADGGIFPDVDLDADDPEAKVSRRHARIIRRGEQYYIEDLGSTNGTFINRGRRLLPGDRQPLSDGDEIIVGKTFLRFHIVK